MIENAFTSHRQARRYSSTRARGDRAARPRRRSRAGLATDTIARGVPAVPARGGRRRRAGSRDRTRVRRGERGACLDGDRSAGGHPSSRSHRRGRGARVSVAACSSSTTSRTSCARCRRACAARLRGRHGRRRRGRAHRGGALSPPDAVILDLVLPDRRGTEVCRASCALDVGAGDHPLRRRGRGARRSRPSMPARTTT